MPISPEVDKRIRERFRISGDPSLIACFPTYIEQQAQDPGHIGAHANAIRIQSGIRYEVKLQSLKTNFINLLQALSSKQHSFGDLIKRSEQLGRRGASRHDLRAKSDYENGMLRSVAEMIEANIVARRYLTQAEQLLKVNKEVSITMFQRPSWLEQKFLLKTACADSVRGSHRQLPLEKTRWQL